MIGSVARLVLGMADIAEFSLALMAKVTQLSRPRVTSHLDTWAINGRWIRMALSQLVTQRCHTAVPDAHTTALGIRATRLDTRAMVQPVVLPEADGADGTPVPGQGLAALNDQVSSSMVTSRAGSALPRAAMMGAAGCWLVL